MATPPKLTPGQKKLQMLGIKLPLFPATAVGSLPKHEELKELRYKVNKGVQPESELERKEKLSTELWIREQERIGMDIIVDGEMNRSDIIGFFAKKIDGFVPGGTVRCYGNRYYRKPIIKTKLAWKAPLILDFWKYTQRLTHKPVKAVITGPYTLFDWSFNEHYTSREEAVADLTQILRKEIVQLSENGAKIIQIDEPALTSRPEEFSLVADALMELTKNLKSYVILHHSYGDLGPIWQKVQKLPVDNFDLDATNSNLAIIPFIKKHPTHKDISFGVVESHSHQVDSAREVGDRVRAALKVIPKSQLWLSPDAGLKTRTPEEATAKLRALTQTAAKFRSGK